MRRAGQEPGDRAYQGPCPLLILTNPNLLDPEAGKIRDGHHVLIEAHVHVPLTAMDLAAMTRKPAMLVAYKAAPIMRRVLKRGFTTVRDTAGAV
ncbi:MAG: hypothetical protein P8R42_23580 [Candidatus Binatia bacterium]|nr:hypothetical protein [Candidatus Binatia bacterium]